MTSRIYFLLLRNKMFRHAVRAARPAVLAARSKPSSIRAFSSTVRVLSGGPPQPQLYGEGAKPGTVPTDVEQATGLERLQLLGDIEGINVFDDTPLDSSYLGTKAKPVLVPSYVCLPIPIGNYLTHFLITLFPAGC